MRNVSLLFAGLLMAGLFTACLEEKVDLGQSPELVALADYERAVADGTGLPHEVEVRTAIYTDAKNGTRTEEDLGHIRVRFFSCGEAWCRARTDDCGRSAYLEFQSLSLPTGETLAFQQLDYVPTFKTWAEGAIFSYGRDAGNLVLECTECPGETADGFRFSERRVIMKVMQ